MLAREQQAPTPSSGTQSPAGRQTDLVRWGSAETVNAEFLRRMLMHLDRHFETPGAGSRLADLSVDFVSRSGLALTPKTVFRAVVISLLLALKIEDDNCPSNAEWAATCRMTLKEVNALEREFCAKTKWALWCKNRE